MAIVLTNDTDLVEPIRIARNDLGLHLALLSPSNSPARSLRDTVDVVKKASPRPVAGEPVPSSASGRSRRDTSATCLAITLNAETRPKPGLAPSRRSSWGDHVPIISGSPIDRRSLGNLDKRPSHKPQPALAHLVLVSSRPISCRRTWPAARGRRSATRL
jgi:hypothetical protein